VTLTLIHDLEFDLDILYTKMKILGHTFQKLEHEQDRHAYKHTHTHR